MFEEYHDIFIKSGLTKGIEIDAFDELVQSLNPTIVDYSKGAIIREYNQPLTECGLVLSGVASYVENKENGNRALVETLYSGQVFGIIIQFSSEKKLYPCDLIARTNCRIMFFESKYMTLDYTVPSETHYRVMINAMHQICDRATQLFWALRYFRTRSVREKLSNYFYDKYRNNNNSTTFVLEYNRDDLADYLYIPQPSLSRELANMKREGIIDYYRSTIKILSLEKLLENI